MKIHTYTVVSCDHMSYDDKTGLKIEANFKKHIPTAKVVQMNMMKIINLYEDYYKAQKFIIELNIPFECNRDNEVLEDLGLRSGDWEVVRSIDDEVIGVTNTKHENLENKVFTIVPFGGTNK